MYIVTSFVFFMVGGLLALLMRAELARPGLQFLSPEQYNQLFTMHGTIMLLFYATPVVFGFANYVLPLQIGAPDVAFPRLNALSYWLYVFGALIAISGFSRPAGRRRSAGPRTCRCPGCRTRRGGRRSVDHGRLAVRIAGLVYSRLKADKVIAEAAITASPLNWVIVRPPNLTRGPATGHCIAAPAARISPSKAIPHADCAAALVIAATQPEWIRQVVNIGRP